MTQIKSFKSLYLLAAFFMFFTITNCSDDDNDSPDVTITVNGEVLFDNGDDFNGDVDGDFNSNGGSSTRDFNWQNPLSTADYNADITATAEGSFRMVVRDAENLVVLDKSLIGGAEPDTIDGVTASGTPGIWTVTITVNDFDGDGSFSLSAGN